MPFQKGHKSSPGRAKGSKNQKTELWNSYGDYLTGEMVPKIVKTLDKLMNSDKLSDNIKGIELSTSVLNYFKPRQQSVDVHQVGQMIVTVRREDANTGG